MAILCAYRTEITLAVVMIGLNCRCSKQENTVRNPLLGPPTIPDCEYWYKLGEVDKDTIFVLYACRSGQVGLHSELTIKKTDINGKDIYTSVIGNLPEGRWRILHNSFSCSNTMFSFAMYRFAMHREEQCERRDTAEIVAYTINGNTGKLLDNTPKIICKNTRGYNHTVYNAYCTAEDSYTFIQNAWDNGYLFHVNKYGEDKWGRRMTRIEYNNGNKGEMGFPGYSNNYIVVNGKLVYEISEYWHTLHIMDIKSATLEMTVSDDRLSLRDDEEGTGIFYKLESADFSEDILTVTYGKYCKTPIIEKEYDSILGQWIEKITGYEDVLQGKILYHISYPGGKVLDKQASESLSHITTLSASWCGPGRKSGRPCRGFWRL